ncbi:MAG: sigma-70 family RNA polymerase sigma factor [Dehalococcoidia bacterium]
MATDAYEEDLIRRVKNRDEDAWSELYDLHYANLYRYAFARLRSREEAEDIAAQVFLEALRGIDGFAYRGKPLLAWLYRIARNLVADHLRYQIRRDRAALSMPGRDNFAPGADESLDTLELLDAISKLTIDQQEVLILRFFMSLPARATAQMLGKNETAVFALQVRAIGALRRIMMPRGVSLEAVRAA